MSIFSLSNILANHQKKKKQTNKHQTSTHTSKRLYFYFKYLRKLQSAKPFSTSTVLYIPEDHDRPTPVKENTTRKGKRKGKRKRKGKERRKRKGRGRKKRKGRRRRKRKGMRRRKEGRKGIMEEAGLKKYFL